MKTSTMFFLSGLILPLFACFPEKSSVDIDPPPTPVLTSQSTWAVAKMAYVRVLTEHDIYADICGLLRYGDVVELISKVIRTDGNGYWLRVRLLDTERRGWTLDEDLDIYDTEHQARIVSKDMLEKE